MTLRPWVNELADAPEIPSIPADALVYLSEGMCPDCGGPLEPREPLGSHAFVTGWCEPCRWLWAAADDGFMATITRQHNVAHGVSLLVQWACAFRPSLRQASTTMTPGRLD